MDLWQFLLVWIWKNIFSSWIGMITKVLFYVFSYYFAKQLILALSFIFIVETDFDNWNCWRNLSSISFDVAKSFHDEIKLKMKIWKIRVSEVQFDGYPADFAEIWNCWDLCKIIIFLIILKFNNFSITNEKNKHFAIDCKRSKLF